MLEHNSISMRFRHLSQSNNLIGLIESKIHRLKERHPQVHNCTVVVDKRHQRHNKGNPINARVTLDLPGKVIVSSKRNDGPNESISASAALVLAFDAAEHAADKYLRRHRLLLHRSPA